MVTGIGLKISEYKSRYTPADLKRYYTLANEGNVYAQFALAYGYFIGSFGRRDPIESMRWCSLALQKDLPLAKLLYDMYHFSGFGVPKDYALAFRWWSEAANDGDRNAQVHTAWAYTQGVGVTKDSHKAFDWWLKAAQQGDSSAQYTIAHRFENGDGTNKDITAAYIWYLFAEMNGYADASNALTRVRTRLMPNVVEEAKKQIAQWLQQNPLLDNKNWELKFTEMQKSLGDK